ncbi:antitoxin VbhA family protein [Bacillus sp. 'calajunan']|uniref:antitoxin VbhA family protein n=1 Tax=Bacillus sp. 'calajunan' TaxID=3447457 RepID=UPI003EDF974B
MQKDFEAAKTTLAIEGLTVTKEMEKVIKDKLRGKITMEELIKLADDIARRK